MSRYKEILKKFPRMPGTQWTHRTIKTEDYKYLIDIIEKQKEASNNGMKYGCHHLSCLIDCGHPCTCGFTEALVKWHEALALTE